MANAKTDFSISATVRPDTSQVQRTLDHARFRTNVTLDIDTHMVQDRINNLVQSSALNGFDRINTKIQTGLRGFDQYGNAVSGLIKYTETFKNAIGDVQERVTLLSQYGRVLGQSTQTISHGVQEITTDTRQFNEVLNGLNTTVTQVTKTTTDTAGNTRQVVETTREWTDAAGRLNTEITTTNELNEQIAPTIRNVSNNIRQAGDAAQQTATQVNGLGRSFANAVATLTRYYIASLPIRTVQTLISETVETLRDFDSALIEFRKVSDLAGESLTDYVAKLAEMGEVTGSTMQAMVEAATEFKKSGFDDEDSAKLASIAEMYRNIADEEISAGDAASFIIAQMKAFHVEAEGAQHIIDAVNEVANNFSVSSADLARNLGNMSEIMAINNVSMEQQIGMLTGVTEITRNASSASRGLVMISSRLTQVLDESSSTGKKLTKIYNDLGIELLDEEGQLRSHYDILGDLATKWNDLSENQQKYIALTSAGARQQQNFVALMDNWGQVASATATALSSSVGEMSSAQRENEKVMDSISKKIEILRSQFQQLVIGDGGLQNVAKSILDVGIAFLRFANSDVAEVIAKTALLVAAFVALQRVITSTTVVSLVAGFREFTMAIVASVQGLMAYATASGIATTTTGAFSFAVRTLTADFLALMATNPIGWIALIGVAVFSSIKAMEQYNARLHDAAEELKNLSKEVDSAESDLENLKKALQELKKQIEENNKQKLRITDENELDRLEKETAELSRQEKILERQVILQERKLEAAQKEADRQARTTLATTTESQFNRQNVVDTFSGAETGETRGVQVTPEKELQLAIDKYKELQQVAQELQEQLDKTDPHSEEWETLNNQLTSTEEEMDKTSERGVEMAEIITNATDEMVGADDEYKDSLLSLVDTFLDVTNTQKETEEQVQETNEALEEEEEEVDELSKELENLIQSLGITETEFRGLQKTFGGNDEVLIKYLRNLANVRQELSDTSTVIDNLQEALDTASTALEEYNQNGYLTIDTFQSLMGISAQYLAALVNENGQLEINQTTLGNLVDQLKIAKIEELANAAAMEIAALQYDDTDSSASAAQKSVDAAGDAFTRAGDKASKASAGVALFNAELQKATGGQLGDFTGSEKIIIDKYRKLAKEISTLTVNTTKAGNAAKSAGKKGSGAAKEAKDATKELNKELEETKKKYDTVIKWIGKQYDKEIDKIKKSKDEAVKAEDEKIKAKEKEKDTALDAIEAEIRALEREKNELKAQKEVLDERKNALKDEEDEIVKSIEKRIKVLEKERDALIKPIEERIKVLEKERDAIVDSTQAEIDAITELKEQRQTYWDEQINALKEANKELKDNLELQEKLDALKKAKNTKVKIYKEGQGFVYDVDQNAVQKAQKELDEYLSQKAYEDELARLEALKNAEIKSYEDRLNELKTYKDNTKKTYDQQIEDLKNYKDSLKENYTEQIDNLKEYKETVQEQYEEQIELLNQDIDALERHMDELDKHKDALEEHKDAVEEQYEAEISALEAHKDEVERAYDAEIQAWEGYKQGFEDMVNAYEEQQNRLLFEQLTGIKDESNNWMTRLDNLAEFVRKYNELQKQLDTDNTDVSNNASMKEGSTPSSSYSNGYTSSSRTVTNYNTSTNRLGGDAQYTPSYNSKSSSSKYGAQPTFSSAAIEAARKRVSKHAKGVSSVANNEVALVGDSPNQELVIGSKLNGSLMSLDKGTGVVNANSATTLAGMLNQVGKYGASGFGSGGGTLNNNYNNDSLTINGVTIQGSNISSPETFVNGLLNLKAEALQRAYRHR